MPGFIRGAIGWGTGCGTPAPGCGLALCGGSGFGTALKCRKINHHQQKFCSVTLTHVFLSWIYTLARITCVTWQRASRITSKALIRAKNCWSLREKLDLMVITCRWRVEADLEAVLEECAYPDRRSGINVDPRPGDQLNADQHPGLGAQKRLSLSFAHSHFLSLIFNTKIVCKVYRMSGDVMFFLQK